MNFLNISAEGYIRTYARTDVTNALHGSAGFRTDNQIITKQKMHEVPKKRKNNFETSLSTT